MVKSAAPGLQRRKRGDGTIAWYWVATAASKRADARDYWPHTVRLHSEDEAERLTMCRTLTAELMEWLGGTTPSRARFDGTLASLIRCYQLEEESPYRTVKYNTRRHYDESLATLEKHVGAIEIRDMNGRDFTRWYRSLKEPSAPGKPERVRRAHNAIKVLRIVLNYGASCGYRSCAEAALMLSKQRFAMPPPRKVAMTYEQAALVVAKALEVGRPSIALAQALQFELSLRQRDVIGEWIDAGPGEGGIVSLGKRWTGGIAWSDIDAAMVLRKATTKTGALGEWDLRCCPLVLRTLAAFEPLAGRVGPVIVSESAGRPYFYRDFIRQWRAVATSAGVPRDVWNMDSRAGGITEGGDAGASIEDLRKHATHTNATMTTRYVRGTLQSTRRVADLRSAKREKGDG